MAEEVTIRSTVSDCAIRNSDTDYDTVHDATDGDSVDTGEEEGCSPTVPAGQYRSGVSDKYYIYRIGLFFDTSVLAGKAVLTATLSIFVTQWRSGNRDFDIVVQSGMPTYPHEPAVVEDYDRNLYSGDYGSISSVGKPQYPPDGDRSWREIELNDVSIINTSGITKLLLRSSRDIAGSSPGDIGSLEERAYFYRKTSDTDYDEYAPKLTITYTAKAKHHPTHPTEPRHGFPLRRMG